MAKLPYASVAIDAGIETSKMRVEPRSDVPFRILLLGDFSGRAQRGEPSPGRLRPYLIDRDNLDEVMARIRPELQFGDASRGMIFRFRELDDFHPDNLFEHHDLFRSVREQRRTPSVPPKTPPPSAPPRAPTGGNLLDDILDDSEARPRQSAPHPDPLREMIDKATAPYLAPREDPAQAQAIEEMDAMASKLMRALLHYAHFQSLEAAWRAVDWLLRGLETGAQLKVYILDVSKDDLPGSLPELHRMLVTTAATPGAEPWALAVGNYVFERTERDIILLGELARIMHAGGVPWLAEANPGPADSETTERLWQALRASPEARFVGLLLPRFLLRLPYGAMTNTVESFPFEEMPGSPVHQHYLWANPAFAAACLLGQAFGSLGWDLHPGAQLEIKGLPLHIYDDGGEKQSKPCAELWMTEEEAESLLEQGYMPLASIKQQDAARLVRFQSIAAPAAPLAGRWTSI